MQRGSEVTPDFKAKKYPRRTAGIFSYFWTQTILTVCGVTPVSVFFSANLEVKFDACKHLYTNVEHCWVGVTVTQSWTGA